MSLNKEIGGFLSIDANFAPKNTFSGIKLASGRQCLAYIAHILNIKKLHIPYYTCPVVRYILNALGIKSIFYHIGKDFLPTSSFDPKDFILYTNYFGLCARQTLTLAEKYPNLIIDNAQAFYMPNTGKAGFNSPRKFFGVADGGFLYCEKHATEPFRENKSFKTASYLLQRTDCNAKEAYNSFLQNEKILETIPSTKMSRLTQSLLERTDLGWAKEKRLENFNFLHKTFKKRNVLSLNIHSYDVPLIYPFISGSSYMRQYLITNHIYSARYWPDEPAHIAQFSPWEQVLQQQLIAIPIDQRYNKQDMQYIVDIINKENL